MEENFNFVEQSTQPPFITGLNRAGTSEKSEWIFEDGSIQLQYGQDLLDALERVIASPDFQDHRIINNAPIFLLPQVALQLEGESNLTLGGGLLYGAQYAVGGTLLRMGWSIELRLTGRSNGALYLFVRIGNQERQVKMDSTSVRFWGIETADITEGPITVAFGR